MLVKFFLLCTKKTTCVPHDEWEAWNGGQDLVTEASLATPLLPGVFAFVQILWQKQKEALEETKSFLRGPQRCKVLSGMVACTIVLQEHH